MNLGRKLSPVRPQTEMGFPLDFLIRVHINRFPLSEGYNFKSEGYLVTVRKQLRENTNVNSKLQEVGAKVETKNDNKLAVSVTFINTSNSLEFALHSY